MSITSKIKTLADAYAALGLNQVEELPFAQPKNSRQVAANAFVDATVLVEALNEGWKPNYDNYNERKWEIWWDMRSEAAGGPGFSSSDFVFAASRSFVGARLVFKERILARYAAEQFSEIFKKFIDVPKG